MNISMKKSNFAAAVSTLLLMSVQPVSAANITCQFNPNSGRLEASLAWKNVLGEEADRACEKVAPVIQRPAAQSTTTIVIKQSDTATPAVVTKPGSTVAVQVAAPAAAPVAVTAPAPVAKVWKVELKDITLSNTFTRWAEAAGWRARWDADKNILVDAPDSFTGKFEDAVASVLSSPGITHGTYPLEVCFYTNTPPLARITRKGEQNDCK